MITSGQIYWLTRLDSIHKAAIPLVVFGIFALVGGIIVLTLCKQWKNNEYMEDDYRIAKSLRWVFWAGLIASIIGTSVQLFVPSTKEMAAILFAPKIVNNEKAQEIPGNMLDFVNDWLKNFRPTDSAPDKK